MKKLNELNWEPFSISNQFITIQSGKGKGLNHLKEDTQGINYIGATNKNNGVLATVKSDQSSKRMIQNGNTIGFIKNGDGSAGYAIYKKENFISTSDVLYGYSNWLNTFTGLFFVAAQDMIENKYSHGYKRNRQHLSGDRVMLPANKLGNPDYDYMEQYIANIKNKLINEYKKYARQQLDKITYVDIPTLKEKEWHPFILEKLFTRIESVKGKTTQTLINGEGAPYIAASKENNGYSNMFSLDKNKDIISRGNCIVFIMLGDGAAGWANYEPMNFIGMSGKISCGYIDEKLNKFNGLFIANCLRSNKKVFSHGHSWTGNRLQKTRVMLPINKNNLPDFDYMEQYIKNLMFKKYNQYLTYINKSN